MKKVRVGINGMGRIGRTIFREVFDRDLKQLDIVAVNNLGSMEDIVHLLRYDSLHGRFKHEVMCSENTLTVKGKKISFTGQADPSKIDWNAHKVDVVVDATGIFKDKKGLGQHLGGTVENVIMCAPGKDLDGTFVMGINHHELDPSRHKIVSNASCTTNCLAPLVKVIDDKWGVVNGFMTTVHAYTSDQCLLDGIHSDWRRARAAAMSMIPTTTGAAKAVGLVLPQMEGKLDGIAIRVPTPDVSMVDLIVNLKNTASKEGVNMAMQEAAKGELAGILDYTDEPLVGQDFRGHRASSIFDSSLTNVIGKTLKIISWYDNEVGFSNRVIDLAIHIGK